MIPAPLFLVVAPLIIALILFILSRWTKLVAACGVATLILIAIIVADVIVDRPNSQVDGGLLFTNSWEVFGRTLAINGQIQQTLLFVVAIMAILFSFTLLFPQGTVFVPVALGILSPMSAALMFQPFLFGAASLVVVAAMLAVLVQGGRVGSTLAAFRLLTMASFAIPLILIAGSMLESGQPFSVATVARLLLMSIVILLAGFPFHIWVAPIVSESKILVPPVVFGLGQLVITLFCYNLLLENPAIGLNAQFTLLLRASAAGTVILGGLLALTARSFDRLLGYVLLIDIGFAVYTISIGGINGLEIALALLILRIVSLLIAGIGLGLLRYDIRSTTPSNLGIGADGGLLRRSSVGLVLFLYGSLSLIGLPLTPGFSGRWAILTMVGERSIWLAIVCVISITLATIGVLRRLPVSVAKDGDVASPFWVNQKATSIVAGILLGFGILLTLFPQSLLFLARYLAQLS